MRFSAGVICSSCERMKTPIHKQCIKALKEKKQRICDERFVKKYEMRNIIFRKILPVIHLEESYTISESAPVINSIYGPGTKLKNSDIYDFHDTCIRLYGKDDLMYTFLKDDRLDTLSLEEKNLYQEEFLEILKIMYPQSECLSQNDYSPENWHTQESQIIYFLIKNREKQDVVSRAAKKFFTNDNYINKIYHFYSKQKVDYLSIMHVQNILSKKAKNRQIS